MKRVIAIAALISGLVVGPVAAQPVETKTAIAADDDLICALWSADATSRAKTEKEKIGLTLLMTYFIGRWEGATGRTIDEGLTIEFVSANFAKLLGANADCLKRSGEFGQRLQLVGSRLQKPGDGK